MVQTQLRTNPGDLFIKVLKGFSLMFVVFFILPIFLGILMLYSVSLTLFLNYNEPVAHNTEGS